MNRTRPSRHQYRFPFVRPRLPNLALVEEFFGAAREQGIYSNFGPNALAFEQELKAAYFAADSAVVTCANCTSGITASLIAARVAGPVIIPAFTFAATELAVRAAGLVALPADVSSTTAHLSPDTVIELARRSGADAVVAVRPYGIWSDLSALAAACSQHDLTLIIDNAAGLGVAPEVVRRFAVPGVIEVFSLHITKPFGIGEGGVILCPAAMEDDVRSALNFGLWTAGSIERGRGINGKMDELSAAMARAVLRNLPDRIRNRQAVARRYNDLNASRYDTFCPPGMEERAAWQCFPLRLPADADAAAISKSRPGERSGSAALLSSTSPDRAGVDSKCSRTQRVGAVLADIR